MSRSQHIIKQEHHPLMSSETRIFFLGLDFFLAFLPFFPELLILRLRESATRKWKVCDSFETHRSWSSCALGLFRNSFVQPDSVSVGVCRSLRGLCEGLEMSVKSLDAVKRKIQCLQQQADDAQDRAQFLQTQLDNERDLREKVRKHHTFPCLHSCFFLYCFCLLLSARLGPRWTETETGASCHTLEHVSHGILAWCYVHRGMLSRCPTRFY